eukprot:629930-Rhodomonas_salina.2
MRPGKQVFRSDQVHVRVTRHGNSDQVLVGCPVCLRIDDAMPNTQLSTSCDAMQCTEVGCRRASAAPELAAMTLKALKAKKTFAEVLRHAHLARTSCSRIRGFHSYESVCFVF